MKRISLALAVITFAFATTGCFGVHYFRTGRPGMGALTIVGDIAGLGLIIYGDAAAREAVAATPRGDPKNAFFTMILP